MGKLAQSTHKINPVNSVRLRSLPRAATAASHSAAHELGQAHELDPSRFTAVHPRRPGGIDAMGPHFLSNGVRFEALALRLLPCITSADSQKGRDDRKIQLR